jgi:hypothetical protein
MLPQRPQRGQGQAQARCRSGKGGESFEQGIAQQRNQRNRRQDRAPAAQHPAGRQIEHQAGPGNRQGQGQVILPAGSSRLAVRGFRRSMCRSKTRFMAMPKTRAPTAATTISSSTEIEGKPVAGPQPGAGEDQRQAECGVLDFGEIEYLVERWFRLHVFSFMNGYFLDFMSRNAAQVPKR